MPRYIAYTSGTGSFTVPADILGSTATVIAVGGGGGGGRPSAGLRGGSGGGGGGYSQSSVTVSAGQTIYYSIGTGGSGATTINTNGVAGGDTWVNISTNAAPTLSTDGALGKGGGAGRADGVSTSGGQASSGVGATKTNGGGGGSTSSLGKGGGGGGSAGTSAAAGGSGGNASGTTTGGGGGGGTGGNGGSGGTTSGGTAGSSRTLVTTGGNGGVGGTGSTTAAAGSPGNSPTLTGGAAYTGVATYLGPAGGGGGGGGNSNAGGGAGGAGAAGASYGGGGGGGGTGNTTSGNGGDGAGGCVIFIYDVATLYWVGGTGTWKSNDGDKWAGSSGGAAGYAIPDSKVNVVFDASSDSGAPFTVTTASSSSATLGSAPTANNLTASGLDQAMTLSMGAQTNIDGDLNIPASNFSASGGSDIALSSSLSQTITTNGNSLGCNFRLNGNGTVSLSGSLTTSGYFLIASGTLALGANTLSCGRFQVVGTLTSAITRTSGNITITGGNTFILGESVKLSNNSSLVSFPSGLVFNCNYAGSTGTRYFDIGQNCPVTINITAGTDTINLQSSFIEAINFTGFAGTWTNTSSTLGSLTVSTGMTVGSGSNTVTFGYTGSITSNGKTFDFYVDIDGSGITTTLNDALTLGSSTSLELIRGTLSNAGNYNVTAGFFNSSGSNARTLALGSGIWTITGSGATAWNCATSTNLTVTGTGVISMSSASAKTFAGGNVTTWPVLRNAGAGALTISGNSTFTTIENTVQPTTFKFTSGTTQTVTNFNVNGSFGNLVTINSTTPGSQFTLSKASGMINVQYLSIQDSNATGGATWYAFLLNGNVNAGNNTGWIFSNSHFFVFFM